MTSLPGVRLPKRLGTWRLEEAAIAQDINCLSRRFQSQGAVPNSQALIDAIDTHLESVQDYLSQRSAASPTSAVIHLEAAQADLLRMAPLSYVRSCLPSFVVQARRTFEVDDLHLTTLEDLAGRAELAELTEDQRQTIVECVRGTAEQTWRAHHRLQNLRGVITATAGLFLVLAAILTVVNLLYPTLIPLCFVHSVSGQTMVACPAAESEPFVDVGGTGAARQGTPARDTDDVIRLTASPADILLVEFIGFLSAALAGALAIRNIQGGPDYYGIVLALVALKFPAGAITALLGVVLIGAGFVPNIDTLDSSAQIIAWAIAFGYAQQMFTGIVDRQARTVLEQSSASLHILHPTTRTP
jgi:xanthosine utilization system XapX-like protein